MPAQLTQPRLDRWKFRWDVVLFFSFVLAAMRHWTELPAHEILGLFVVPTLAVHLWLNWNWIVDVLRRPSASLRGEVRFNRAWDLAQSGVACLAVVSGLVVSRHLLPALGLTPLRNRFIDDVHAVSSWVLLVMIGIHLGVHVPWIWSKVRRPRFALIVALVTLLVVGATRLDVVRKNGAFSRRFRGDSIKATAALVPPGLLAFGLLTAFRRRRSAANSPASP